MLYYLPLEPYIERYTSLMSCSNGWTEHHFDRLGIEFMAIRPADSGTGTIGIGSVLDSRGRSRYAMAQIAEVIDYVEDGDAIYTEDFWHPGIESLFYMRALEKRNFRIACFCHAQTIDDQDFTYPMRKWMAPMEVGMARGYDAVFFASSILEYRASKAGWPNDHMHVVGLPYNEERLLEQVEAMGVPKVGHKERTVLFSSRFDPEKDPAFFLDVVDECPEIEFRVVKPRDHLTDDRLLEHRVYGTVNLEVIDTSQSKADYYNALMKAKVQFNCAHQDWVSWTLLEALTFKCNPVYPIHRDFPAELEYRPEFLYPKGDVQAAAAVVREQIDAPFGTHTRPAYHSRYWDRVARTLELI